MSNETRMNAGEAMEAGREREAIEMTAAHRAYDAGLGVSEWEAFLTDEEAAALAALSPSTGGKG